MDSAARTKQLVGEDIFQKIQNLRIAVFGLGAVGSFAIEALARCGVGYLRLIDFDTFHPTNLNRQIFALHSTLNQPKTKAAERRVKDINPACQLDIRNTFIDRDTINPLLQPDVDIVIDAIDCVASKLELIKTAIARDIAIVSSMGAGGRTQSDLIRVGNLFDSYNCPLAKVIRKRLRQSGVRSKIPCVYSVEQPRNKRPHDPKDADVLPEGVRPRPPIGTISYLPGIFGLKLAQLALEITIGKSIHLDN
jgi:tRNA threonylcarbamoyladenosine dehydratase